MSAAACADSHRVRDALLAFRRLARPLRRALVRPPELFRRPVGGGAKALYYRRPMMGLVAVAPMILSEALLPSAHVCSGSQQRFAIADAHYAMGFAMLTEATAIRPTNAARFISGVLE